MWHVQVARKARTTEDQVTKLAGFGMQVAQAQATFCACLRRGPIAPILLVRTEHDSAGHGDLDASSSGAAGLESALNRMRARQWFPNF